MRIALTALLVTCLALPAVVADPIVLPPAPEALVEGHTVYARLQSLSNVSYYDAATSGAAGAPAEVATLSSPPGGVDAGVRWFNDQDLLAGPLSEPMGAVAVLVEEGLADGSHRSPCAGAVLATRAGAPDPRPEVPLLSPVDVTAGGDYVETYLVTDPNEREWTIDVWRLSTGDLLWAVALNGAEASRGARDDGVARCAPQDEASLARATGRNGLPYPGREEGLPTTLPSSVRYQEFQYNALLVLPIDPARAHGHAPDHAEGSADWQRHHTACGQPSDCPEGNDDLEGNSHPFLLYPEATSLRRPAHGGTADCDGDGLPDAACHATMPIALYYDVAPRPYVRNYVIFEQDGALDTW